MQFIGHHQQWLFLKQIAHNHHMPHALLFSGEESLGKKKIAFQFVKMIFCQHDNQEQRPCEQCTSCLLTEKAAHPDLIFINSQPHKEIVISQMRNLRSFLSLQPIMSAERAVIINNAHCLNEESQNCFLKILEEPPKHTFFILITAFPHLLLPTIRSRCANVKFYPVGISQLKQLPFFEKVSQDLPDIGQRGQPGIIFQITASADFKEQKILLEKCAKNFLHNDRGARLLFIKEFFEKNKENFTPELSLLLETITDVLRSALRVKVREEALENIAKIAQRIKKAIELTESYRQLLQTTNVNGRLLLENLALNI